MNMYNARFHVEGEVEVRVEAEDEEEGVRKATNSLRVRLDASLLNHTVFMLGIHTEEDRDGEEAKRRRAGIRENA